MLKGQVKTKPHFFELGKDPFDFGNFWQSRIGFAGPTKIQGSTFWIGPASFVSFVLRVNLADVKPKPIDEVVYQKSAELIVLTSFSFVKLHQKQRLFWFIRRKLAYIHKVAHFTELGFAQSQKK